MLASETKVDTLRSELDSLHQAKEKIFKAPAREWIASKLSKFNEVLEMNSGESAMALRKLLGPMKLKPQDSESGKPYYVAHSSINALAITEPLPGNNDLDNGSGSFHWCARKGRIRTVTTMQFSFGIQSH